jgi:hypothetical protein
LNMFGATRCFRLTGFPLRSRMTAFIPDQPHRRGSLPSPARTNWYAFENESHPSPLSSLLRTSEDALPTLSPVGANESRRPCAAFSPPDARQAVLARPGCPSRLPRWILIHHRDAVCGSLPTCGFSIASLPERPRPPEGPNRPQSHPRLAMAIIPTVTSIERL